MLWIVDGNVGLGIYCQGMKREEADSLIDALIKSCSFKNNDSVDFGKMAVPYAVIDEPLTDASKEKVRASMVRNLNKLKKDSPGKIKTDIDIIVNK